MAELGNAQARGVEQFKDSAVAQGERIGIAYCGQQPLDFGHVECIGQITFDPRGGDKFGRITRDPLSRDKKAEEDPQGDGFGLDRCGSQTLSFTMSQVVAQSGWFDRGKVIYLPGCQPLAKALERSAGGELVVVGQPALGGEEKQKRVDLRLEHRSEPQAGKLRVGLNVSLGCFHDDFGG